MAKIELKAAPRHAYLAFPEDLWVVGIDTAHLRGEHHLYDDRSFLPLDQAMVENMARFGCKQPVLIEASDDPLHPYVKDGNRRTMHLRAANILRDERGLPRLQMECIDRAEDAHTSAMTKRIANKFRKDDDVLADAQFAKDLLVQGCSEEDVMSIFNVTKQTLDIWTKKVVDLPEKLKEAVRGGVGVKAALAIATKPEEEWDGLLGGEGKAAPVADQDDEPAVDLPKRKIEKKKAKVSTAAIEGVRGKKWFKNMLRYKEHLPAEFVQGMEFVLQMVEDGELPASLRKWVDGNRWDLGEISDPPSKVIAGLISKTHKQEQQGVDAE